MVFRNIVIAIIILLVGPQRALGSYMSVFANETTIKSSNQKKHFTSNFYVSDLYELNETMEGQLDDDNNFQYDFIHNTSIYFGFLRQNSYRSCQKQYLKPSGFIYSNYYIRIQKSVFQI